MSNVWELSLKHRTQRHNISERTVAAGRQIKEGDGVCDSILAVLNVLVLPDPPDTINLGVVNLDVSVTLMLWHRQETTYSRNTGQKAS